MSTKQVLQFSTAVGAIWVGAFVNSVEAGSHTWRISELFSNADGTIQFVEISECCGFSAESGIGGKNVTSDALLTSFVFPANLPFTTDTANKKILLATQSFADLPGAPVPDHIFAAGSVPFFSITGDTIRYAPAFGWDVFTFGALDLPTDGINSLQITNFTTHTFITAANTPTNCAGVTGSVDANPALPCPADITPVGPPVGNGVVNIDDLVAVLNGFGPCSAPPAPCVADITPDGGNGVVNIDDLVALLNAFGACP